MPSMDKEPDHYPLEFIGGLCQLMAWGFVLSGILGAIQVNEEGEGAILYVFFFCMLIATILGVLGSTAKLIGKYIYWQMTQKE